MISKGSDLDPVGPGQEGMRTTPPRPPLRVSWQVPIVGYSQSRRLGEVHESKKYSSRMDCSCLCACGFLTSPLTYTLGLFLLTLGFSVILLSKLTLYLCSLNPKEQLGKLSFTNNNRLSVTDHNRFFMTNNHRKPKSYTCSKRSFKPMVLVFFILMLMIVPVTCGPRTRGGPSSSSSSMPTASDQYPNMIKDWDFLPGMKRWNGQPFYDFIRIWWVALTVALGTIVQDGNTLLSAAEGTDEGRDPDNDPADKVRQHNNRNARVYACILNYISPKSRVYRIAMQEFPNNGRGLFVWLREYGKLEYDETTRRELVNEWDDATMARVGIKFTAEAIWEWLDYVDELGDKINRTLSQRRKKFLDGFPESFDVIVAPERLRPDPGSYVQPNTYPSHHPLAGQPNPNAGRPDLYAMVKAFYPEWNQRIKSRNIKSVPKGYVHQVDSDHDEDKDEDENADSDDDAFAMTTPRRQITSRTVCGICGGRGHYGRVDGMDCLTKQLNITIPRSELAQTKYPNGITYPFSADVKTSRHNVSHRPSSTMHPRNQPSVSNTSKPRTAVHRPSKTRSKPKHVKHIDEAEPEIEEHDEEQSHSGSEYEAQVSKLAVAFHTIDTRLNYKSYSSDSDQ